MQNVENGKSVANSVDRRLAKTAAAMAAAVGAGLVGQAQPVEAATIAVTNANINIPTSISGVYLNVVSGVHNTSPVAGWDINLWGSSSLFMWANNSASPSDGIVSSLGSNATLTDNLAEGTLVSGALGFARANLIETTGPTAFLLNSTNNYIGFRFLNEGTGQLNFGWAQLSLAGAFNGQPRSILAYAYEDTGAAIAVGDIGGSATPVPEPATLSMLALGSAGLGAYRRRRQQKQQSN